MKPTQTITMAAYGDEQGLVAGDTLILNGHRPWWLRLWHWITRKKPDGEWLVVSCDGSVITITNAPPAVSVAPKEE